MTIPNTRSLDPGSCRCWRDLDVGLEISIKMENVGKDLFKFVMF